MTNSAKSPPSKDPQKPFDPLAFGRKFMELMEQAAPVMQDAMAKYRANAEGQGFSDKNMDPLNIQAAASEFWGHYARNPSRLVEQHLKYWEDMSHLWQQSAQKFWDGPAENAADGDNAPAPKKHDTSDRRFRDPLWHDSGAYDFIRQSYLLTRKWAQETLNDARELSATDRQKLEFYTRQLMDALAPNNFILTNPEVMRETLHTGGDNLLKGLQNFIDDMKRGQGELKISTTKYAAFKLGENLATTPGAVVYRNEMMELIHYTPTTKNVHAVPLLIVPPWINKYYILDMHAANSYVKYAVDQGFSTFIISWVNPDKSYRNVLFDEYMTGGILSALDVIEEITGTKTTNVVGYCIGGTLAAMTLSYLAKKKQSSRINSTTFLTTLLDFEHAGEMKVFIDEPQLDALEEQMKETGFLDAGALQKTFAILRANDMIWSFVVNNYMMGREPFPFDLLYWNEDSTNLPARFHAYYLRHLYLRNDLIKPNKLKVGGQGVDLSKIKTPLFFLSTREDHIAPWVATYAGAKLINQTNKDVTFVLAASGHVAGVVNPAASEKYGYWTAKKMADTPDDFVDAAEYASGSWWPTWAKWVAKKSGAKVAAVQPGAHKKYPSLCAAPGTYVAIKA